MKGTFRVASLAVAVAIAGCGGDGSSGSDSPSTGADKSGSAVKGSAVKGPLANAAVTLYQLDFNAAGGLGEQLDTGSTDREAAFSGVSIPDGTSGEVLVEVQADADTLDLTTGQAPVITRLLSVTSAEAVAAGETNYPTPLSTLVVNMALSNADSNTNGFIGDTDGTVTAAEWTAALKLAKHKVRSQFGFGLLDNSIDLLSSPPLITSDQDDQAQVVKLRMAVEAVAALMADMAKTAKLADPGSTETADSMFNALSEDLNDGQVDGKSGEAAIASFANIADVVAEVTQNPSSLTIPGSTKTVSQVASVVAGETQDTGVDTDTSTAENTFPVVEPAVVESDIDLDGTPDTSDADIDGDGLLNEQDTAPYDPDRDEDGVEDGTDAFPDDSSETTDTDEDGVGDNSDKFPEDPAETIDSDEDGVGDNGDVFPEDPSETSDADNDGVGDNSDAFPSDASETMDSDSDGVGDNADAFPNDPNEALDSDGDGVGDNADAFPGNANESADRDNDGVGDNEDAFPDDATESEDADGDGYGANTADPDDADPCNPDTNAPSCTTETPGAVWNEFDWDEANWQ
ncbi:hypothetical protein [Alcanivorax sp.]|jgi:hypothetical protein|uniref:hypothetical protein n=1 Tax=Alcanivorax sp. TaxID=1872427 RepID=UPI0032D955C7